MPIADEKVIMSICNDINHKLNTDTQGTTNSSFCRRCTIETGFPTVRYQMCKSSVREAINAIPAYNLSSLCFQVQRIGMATR